MRTFTAPGKLFLSGEYAVLWGGTARVLAVGPRVACMARRREDREVHLLLEGSRLSGLATRKGVTWGEPLPADFRFVARTVDLALRAHGREALGFELAFAPSPLGEGGHKLGLGSSARATVLAAEASRWALDDRYDALKLALVAHAEAQGGKGSGGDVAACFVGGLIRYRRFDVTSLLEAARGERFGGAIGGSPPVELSRVGLGEPHFVFAYSGEASSTTGLLTRIEGTLDATARLRFVTRSDALGGALEDGLMRGDFLKVRESIEGLQALLVELGSLMTPGLERILAIARSYGCAAKISGAGGGDGCIIVAPDAQAELELRTGLASRGIHCLPAQLEQGVRGETRNDPVLSRWLDPSLRTGARR